jgi:AcrR family transcriptional regulator
MLQSTASTRRLPKSEATIAKVLSAAAGLFESRSYAEVTMNQIAEAARVTKGALYHHFAGKEELYLAMMHSDLKRKRRQFAQALSAGTTGREKLRHLTQLFFSLSSQEQSLMKLVRRDVNIFAEPERTKLIRAYQAALPEQVEQAVRAGIESGELAAADPRLLAWHFVALVEVVLAAYADRVFADPRAKLDYVMNLFFAGAAAGSA